MPSTNNVSPPAGSTTIDSDLKIEVEILALAALRHIASDIAQRIDGLIRDQNPRPCIVMVREDRLEDITKSRLLSSRLQDLEKAITVLEADTKPVANQNAKEVAEPLLAGPLSAAAAIAQAATNFLAFFRADTEYKGRAISLDETALHPAIGGQLLALGIEPVQASSVSLQENDPILDQLNRAPEMREKLSSLRDREDDQDKKAQVDVLIRTIDSLMQTIAKRDGEYDLSRLSIGGKLADLLKRDSQSLVLTAKVLTAGGKYKIRRHLFTTLFWGDQLSYGGGATVAFSLFNPRTGKVVLSDVLFHLTDSVKFSESNGLASKSNLLTSEASGTQPLTLPQARQFIAAPHTDEEQVSPNGGDARDERRPQSPASTSIATR